MRKSPKSLLFAAASVASITFCSSAIAQTASPSASPTTVGEVVVTGSHVIKDGTAAPTPVTVLGAQELLTRAPTSIPDALNELPQFRGSVTNAGAIGFANGVRLGDYLNLRNLGVQRVLVTLDGVRVPATNLSGGVDIDTLPQALVSRVDVVTGGASAAYGSDAVAGVVNFVLDKNFNGVKGSIQTGRSRYDDAYSDKETLVGGTSLFDGRLHLEGSAEHSINYGITNNDRSYSRTTYASYGGGTAASPFVALTNAHSALATPGGLIFGSPLSGFAFGPDGSVHKADLGIQPPGSFTLSIGGEGGTYHDASATGYLRSDTLFGRASFEITPAIEAYVQGSYSESRDRSGGITDIRYPFAPVSLTIFRDNAYLQPSVLASLGTAPAFVLGRFLNEEGVAQNTFTNNNTTVQAGLDGKLGGSWKWQANYLYGFALQRADVEDFNSARLYASVDAVRDPATGNIVCRVSLTNPGLYPGCVPSDVLGAGNMSPAAVAYVAGMSQYQIRNRLSLVSANLSGDLLTLPGGPLSVAVGAEYRSYSLAETSNANPAIPQDFTGIRGVPAGAGHYYITNAGVASGRSEVKEVYGEFEAPLLKDQPWAKSLDLNGAIRVTDYSTSGTVTTWKAGLSWQPTDDLRVRTTVSRDIRAPTLNELYAGTQAQPQTLLDPHTGVQVTFFAISHGNPSLQPEIADTYTGGIVFKPHQIPSLSMSVDYYHIDISNVITTISNTSAVTQCELSNGTSPICGTVIRPFPFSDHSPANAYTAVITEPLNLAELNQSGIDLEASYALPMDSLSAAWGGELRFRMFANILLHQISVAAPGLPALEGAGCCDNPKYAANLSVDYNRGPLTVGLVARGFSSFDRSNTLVFANFAKEPGVVYFDAHATYEFGQDERYQAFFNVRNLFNKQPPIVPSSNINTNLTPPTDPTMYDLVGTYFTAGLRFKF